MKALTPQWLEIAEGDLLTAQRESAAHDRPNLRSAAFHAQQAAEKFIKAVLQERSIAFPRTHGLNELVLLLDPPEPRLTVLRDDLEELTRFAAEVRYPGAPPTPQAISEALVVVGRVRAICLDLLGLSA
jgi:HEPN domain-containing protein